MKRIGMRVNGVAREVECEDGELLVEVLRDRLALTGTNVGCLNGDCGACTVGCDGEIVKSCLVLGAGCDGVEVTTIEGFAPPGELDPVQAAMWDEDAFQCGFCLPGMLFSIRNLLDQVPDPADDEIREALAGTLCRCTGYANHVAAVRRAVAARSAGTEVGDAPQRA
jgi:carbon-monoxide dehydrogenase small subunit